MITTEFYITIDIYVVFLGGNKIPLRNACCFQRKVSYYCPIVNKTEICRYF